MTASRRRGVTKRVSETTRYPQAGTKPGDDVRTQITLTLPEFSPSQLRFDFLRYIEVDNPEYPVTYELVGFALERPTTLAEAEDALTAGDDGGTITAEQVDRLYRYFWSYRRIAELRLRFDDAGWKHRSLVLADIQEGTPLYRNLELLVEEYRSRKGTNGRMYDMAEALGCSRKTIWLYLGKAVDAGLIAEDELPKRRR